MLRREARHVRLAITPQIIEGLSEALARGQIDLAVTIPEFAMSDLPSRLLYRERYVVAVRPQHPLARRRVLTAEHLCNYDHVLVSPTGGSFEGPTDQALARLELIPGPAQAGGNRTGVPRALRGSEKQCSYRHHHR